MSIYLEQYPGQNDDDQSNYCRVLEMKLHYLMQQMAAAGLLKDAAGKKITVDLPDSVTSDAQEVQSTLVQNNF